MRGKFRRDVAALAAEYRRRGWTVKRTRGGHLAWRSPRGSVVFSAWSASDWRAIKNTRSLLRRVEREESTNGQ